MSPKVLRLEAEDGRGIYTSGIASEISNDLSGFDGWNFGSNWHPLP